MEKLKPARKEGAAEGETVYATVGNYYGTPGCYKIHGKFYIGIGDWDDLNFSEVSEEFYHAWLKEFGGGK